MPDDISGTAEAAPSGGGRGRNLETSRTPLRTAAGHTQAETSSPPCGSSLEDTITREEKLLERGRSLGNSPWKLEMRRRVMHFTPSWYSVNMGTGITSILLYNMPYQFSGLKNIGNVVFVMNIVLFLFFTGVTLARYILWPSLWRSMLHHPAQSLFLGTCPMGLSTIVNMFAFSVAPAWGGGWVTFTWVLWWINVVIALLVSLGVPYQMFINQKHAIEGMTAAWLLPTVSTIVAAASGGIVADILPPHHARLTVVVSYILWGTGFPVAVLIMAIYYSRLTFHKIPARAQIISTFLPLGPTGQGAFGLLQLGSVVRNLGSEGGGGIVSGGLTAEEGRMISLAVYGGTMPIALVIWGFGCFWVSIAVATIFHTVRRERGVPFNIGWWALTFPIGVFATATTQLGKQLDSGAFRIIGTILSGVVILNWLAVGTLTVVEGARGKLFVAPCLSEMVPRGRKTVPPPSQGV